jgi:hypothetical protein
MGFWIRGKSAPKKEKLSLKTGKNYKNKNFLCNRIGKIIKIRIFHAIVF